MSIKKKSDPVGEPAHLHKAKAQRPALKRQGRAGCPAPYEWHFGAALRDGLRGVRFDGQAFTCLRTSNGLKQVVKPKAFKGVAPKVRASKKQHLEAKKMVSFTLPSTGKKRFYFVCKYCNVVFKNKQRRDVHERHMHSNLVNKIEGRPYYHSKKSGGCGKTHAGECEQGRCLPLPRQQRPNPKRVVVVKPRNQKGKAHPQDKNLRKQKTTKVQGRKTNPREAKPRKQVWFTGIGFSVSGPLPPRVKVVDKTPPTREERERRKALRRRWLARLEWARVQAQVKHVSTQKANRFSGLPLSGQTSPEVEETPQDEGGNVSTKQKSRVPRENWSAICDQFIALNRCQAHGLFEAVIDHVKRSVDVSNYNLRRRFAHVRMVPEEYQEATDPVADEARSSNPELRELVESLVADGAVTQQQADQVLGGGACVRQALSGVMTSIGSAFDAVVNLVDEVAESCSHARGGLSLSIGSMRDWLNRVRSVASKVDDVLSKAKQPAVLGFIGALCSIPFGGPVAFGGIASGGVLAQILTDERRRAIICDFIRRRTGQSFRQLSIIKWLVVGCIVAAMAFYLRDMTLLEILLGSTLGLTCAVAHDDQGSKIKLAVCYHLVQKVIGRTPRRWFKEFLEDSKAIGAAEEIKQGIWSLAYWLMRQVGRLLQFLANKLYGCGFTHLPNWMDQKGRSWYQAAEQGELYGANGRISRFFQRTDTLLGPDSKLSNVKGETSVPVWAMELDSSIHEGEELARLLSCTTSASALIACIRSQVDRLRRAKAERTEKLEAGSSRVTPVVAWFAGPAGTGKTVFCSELGKRLGELQLKLISRDDGVDSEQLKTASSVFSHTMCGDEVWFKSGSDKYWSRYAGQVVMQWDEAGCESLACVRENRDSETYRQFASDWLQLVASTPFKPAVATAEDKGMCVHPLYVIATSNVLGLKPLSDPQALSRRQHFPVLVYADGPKSGDFSHLKMYVPRDVHCSQDGYKVGLRLMGVHKDAKHSGPFGCCEHTLDVPDRIHILEGQLGYPLCWHRFKDNTFFNQWWRPVKPAELLNMMVDLHYHFEFERNQVVRPQLIWGEGDEQPVVAITRRWDRLRRDHGEGREPLRTIHSDGLDHWRIPRRMDPCIGHSKVDLTDKEKILFREVPTNSLPWAVVLSLLKKQVPFPALSLYGVPSSIDAFWSLWGVRVCVHAGAGYCHHEPMTVGIVDLGSGRYAPMAESDDFQIQENYYDSTSNPQDLRFLWEFDGFPLIEEMYRTTLDTVDFQGVRCDSKPFDFALGFFAFRCPEAVFEGSTYSFGRWTISPEILACERWNQVLSLVKPEYRSYARHVYEGRLGYDYVVPFRLLYRCLKRPTIVLDHCTKNLLFTRAGSDKLLEQGMSAEVLEDVYLGITLDSATGGGNIDEDVIIEDPDGSSVRMSWREAICARVLEPFVSKVCETLLVVQGIAKGYAESVKQAVVLASDRQHRDFRLLLKVSAALLGVSLSTFLGFKVLECLTRAVGFGSNAKVRHRRCYNCRDIDGGIWAMETQEPPRHRPSPLEVPDGSKVVAEFKPSQCGGLDSQVVSAQAMACVRDVSSSVGAKVIANIGRITYHNGALNASMYCCNINGNVIMCPAHLVPTSDRGASEFRFTLELRGYTLSGHVIPRHDIKFPSDLSSSRLRDVMLITFRDLPLGGVLKYLGDSEVKTGDQLTILGRYRQDKQHFLVVVRGRVARTGALNYATSLEHLSYPGFVASDMALQPGDCGLLAMCGDRIVGMYVAGDNSFGARRTEFISLLRGDLEGHLSVPTAHGLILGSNRSEITAEVSEVGPVVARVHIDAFSRLPKSGLVLSGLAPGLEAMDKPQLKKPAQLVEPAMIKSLRKFNPDLSQSFDCGRIIQELVGRVEHPHLRSLTSWTEAASGVQDGQRISKGTDLTTSAGLPWVDMGLTKKDLYTVDPSGLIIPGELVVSEATAYETRLRGGSVDSALCFAQLKDELRTIERVDALKTRLFVANPCHVNLVFRKYLLPFISWYKAQRFNLFHAIGVNPFSREWGVIANKAVGRVVMPGDFSRFDATHPRGMVVEAFRFIAEFYDSDLDREMIMRLGDALSNFSYYWRGGVFQACAGQPSGSQITTVLNSIIVTFLFMRCWEEYGFDLGDFGRRCDLVSFGDDSLFFCTQQDSKVLDPRGLVRTMAKYGYEITPPSKGGEMTFVSLQDVEFLGRGFRRDHADVWLPVRQMDLVWSSLWWSSAEEDDVYIDMRLRAAVMEIAVQEDASHQLEELRKVCSLSPVWNRVLGTLNCPQLIQQIRQSCGAAGGYSAVAPHPISSGEVVAEYGSPLGEPLLLTFGPSSS